LVDRRIKVLFYELLWLISFLPEEKRLRKRFPYVVLFAADLFLARPLSDVALNDVLRPPWS
jgi:hypothetical protein